MIFLDRLVERRYCLTHEAGPGLNWKEDALEYCIFLILLITFPLETHLNLSVNGHQLIEHFSTLSVVILEILEREKHLNIFSQLFKLDEVNYDRHAKINNISISFVHIAGVDWLWALVVFFKYNVSPFLN